MIMKRKLPTKLILTTFVLVLTLSLCGCGALSGVDKALKENKTKSDDKYWTERNVPPVELDLEVTCVGDESKFNHDIRVSRCVYKYLEDGDKTRLKAMFSKSVLEENESAIDSEIDELIEYYQSLGIDGFLVESNSVYKVDKVDPKVHDVEHTYHTSFSCNDDRYVLDIMFVDSTLDDDNLFGLHGIRLKNRDSGKEVIVNTISVDI